MITIEFDTNEDGIGGSFNPLTFPAGESFIKLEKPELIKKVVWQYSGDEELMTLAMIFEMARKYCGRFDLHIPYIPHARQDRATTPDQPFSLNIFCKLLATATQRKIGMNITVVDPHSDVSIQKLKEIAELRVIEQHTFAKHFVNNDYNYVIAPDKGAVHKTVEWAKVLEVPMIICDKVRDPSTGWITDYKIMSRENLQGKKVLVVDDIIDGGKSIIMLSETLKRSKCQHVDVFATHGIFSKGIDVFTDVDHLFTTNTLNHPEKFKDNEKLTIFNYCSE